eukprot:4446634-Amphidinium_carterae.1
MPSNHVHHGEFQPGVEGKLTEAWCKEFQIPFDEAGCMHKHGLRFGAPSFSGWGSGCLPEQESRDLPRLSLAAVGV